MILNIRQVKSWAVKQLNKIENMYIKNKIFQCTQNPFRMQFIAVHGFIYHFIAITI